MGDRGEVGALGEVLSQQAVGVLVRARCQGLLGSQKYTCTPLSIVNRYALDPFLDHHTRNRKGETQFLSTRTNVRALKEMLADVERTEVVEPLDWFFHASVTPSLTPTPRCMPTSSALDPSG